MNFSESRHLNSTIVCMKWAMRQRRFLAAMEKLRAKMANGPATELLRRRGAKREGMGGARKLFGSDSYSAVQLDQYCQSNMETFGGNFDVMDDMYGSLGKATLKVALVGDIVRNEWTDRPALHVTRAGFYIRDTYDFNGFQYLGTWTRKGVLNKLQLLANVATGGTAFGSKVELVGHTYNHDFQAYRRATGRGGDFVIYSDVYWESADFWVDLGP